MQCFVVNVVVVVVVDVVVVVVSLSLSSIVVGCRSGRCLYRRDCHRCQSHCFCRS